MARRNRLLEIEREHGDLHQIIPPLVNEDGQARAANELHVTQATICNWLREHHYHRITRYERKQAG